MNCNYQLADIGCESFLDDIETAMEAYTILKVECGRMIGTLPKVDSLRQVMRIKEERRRDLHNLRQELARLEDEIRNGNSLTATQKAASDVSKASKSLSLGGQISNVSKWTYIFTVPTSAALIFADPQPFSVKATAGIITAIGAAATTAGHFMSTKNKWFEIVLDC